MNVSILYKHSDILVSSSRGNGFSNRLLISFTYPYLFCMYHFFKISLQVGQHFRIRNFVQSFFCAGKIFILIPSRPVKYHLLIYYSIELKQRGFVPLLEIVSGWWLQLHTVYIYSHCEYMYIYMYIMYIYIHILCVHVMEWYCRSSTETDFLPTSCFIDLRPNTPKIPRPWNITVSKSLVYLCSR